ncbi:MAG: hypothetical protein HY232_19360 [Acidobacteria bacterium]|nr:hypothetical protein [Acidobacteriota bacterium]
MSGSRLQMLEDFVKRDPRDSFSRYGLAMEYINMKRYEEGIVLFRMLVAQDPEYIPTKLWCLAPKLCCDISL